MIVDSILTAAPYLFVVFIVGIAALMNKQTRIVLNDARLSRKQTLFPCDFIIIGLFLFAALRGDGADYFTYLRRGAAIKNVPDIFENNINMNIGYCVIAWIVNQLHLPAQAQIAAMNLISIVCISHTIHKYSKYKCLSLLIFLPAFFSFDMYAARTAVAISILTLAIPYIINRNFLGFCAVEAFAMLFHPTAIISFALYFLPMVKIRRDVGIVILGAEMLSAKTGLFDILIFNILKLLKIQYFIAKFSTYMNSDLYGYPAKLYDPRLFLAIGLFLWAKERGSFEKDEEKRYQRFLINSSYVTAFVMILFNQHSLMVYRLSAFYNTFTMLLVPQMLCNKHTLENDNAYETVSLGSKKKYRFVCVWILFLVLATAYAVRISQSAPYHFFELYYWK